MPRKKAVAVALTALLSPATFGLGLGNLKTHSALNEPFEARVEIMGATGNDFDALTAKLADRGQFERAGIARDAVLLSLRFEVVSTESGADYVRITSKDAVREPFLNFLLEIDWAKGRLVREYTALLDPPLYDRNRQRPAMTPPVRAPSLASAPLPSQAPTASQPATSVTAAAPAEGTLTVQPNDTAWKLALAHRPQRSLSVQQVMLALLRTNPDAFVKQNVNQLRRGAVLRMPNQAELTRLAPGAAAEEVNRQYQRWLAARQGAAVVPVADALLAPSKNVPAAALPSATPRPSPPPLAKDAHLELAAPEAGKATKAPGGQPGGSLDEALVKEDQDTKTQENSELAAKLTEADQIIDLLQRQVQVKDQELAALQAKLGKAGTPASRPATAPAAGEVKPVLTVAPATPVAAGGGPTGLADAQASESWADRVPGGAFTLLAIGLSLLVGLGVGLANRLRGGGRSGLSTGITPAPVTTSESAIPAIVNSEAIPEPTKRAPDPEQFNRTLQVPAEELAMPAPSAEDPLEEVNVYLAYERFEQAEGLVRKAIASAPNEPKFKLRLLEVFYAAGNRPAFETAARDLLQTVGELSPLWASATAMWAELSPGQPLVGKEVEAPDFVDITREAGPSAPAGVQGAQQEPLISTQVGFSNDLAADTATLDFDVGNAPEALAFDSSVLDVTAGEPHADHDVIDLTATTEEAALDGRFDFPGASSEGAIGEFDEVLDVSSASPSGHRDFALPDHAPAKADLDALTVQLPGSEDFDIEGLDATVRAPRRDFLSIAGQLAGTPRQAVRNTTIDDFDMTLGRTSPPLMQEERPATDLVADQMPELEFDLALEDTADFNSFGLDETLELPTFENLASEGRTDASLEDITRSMEASISGLDLDDDDNSGLDLTRHALNDPSVHLDFGLDETGDLDQFDTLALDPDELRRAAEKVSARTTVLPRTREETAYADPLEETNAKLNLAKAYIELGDGSSARSILDEVVADGSAGQQDEARRLLSQLS